MRLASRWTPNTPLIIPSPSLVGQPGGFQWKLYPPPPPTLDLYSQAWMQRDFGKMRSRSGSSAQTRSEDGGRGVKEGEYRSEERNLLFEQGQECPARGGMSAGEEDPASARKNSVGLSWPRSAGWAGEGARHDGSTMFALRRGMPSRFRLIRRKSLLSVA